MSNSINIMKPSACFEVQKIIGISTSEGNCKTYQVQWAPSWISGVHLIGCEDLIEKFEEEQEEKDIKVEVMDVSSLPDDLGPVCFDKVDDVVIQGGDIHDGLPEQQYPENHSNNTTVNTSPYWDRQESPHRFHQSSKNNNSNINTGGLAQQSIQGNVQGNGEEYGGKKQIHPRFNCLQENVANSHNNFSEGDSKVLSFQCNSSISGENDSGDSDSFRATFIVGESSERFDEGRRLPQTDAYGAAGEYGDAYKKIEHEVSAMDNDELKGEVKKPFFCSICDKTFSCLRSLKCHSRLHSNIYQCIICYRNFTSRRNLERHELIHNDGRYRFPCNVCKMIFNEDEKLQMHLQTHTTRVSRFQCTYCTKVFPDNTKLKRHLRVHTGERPFECKVCLKRFKINHHLQGHLKTHLVKNSKQELKVPHFVGDNVRENEEPHFPEDNEQKHEVRHLAVGNVQGYEATHHVQETLSHSTGGSMEENRIC